MIVHKKNILESLSLVSRFTTSRVSSPTALQGVLFEEKVGKLHLFASNLNSFIHTRLSAEGATDKKAILEPRKLIEFITLLPEGKITITLEEKQALVSAGTIKGTFPLIQADDFPRPPEAEGKDREMSPSFLVENLPLVMFSSSTDDARPGLTGVNFVSGEESAMVATDGFRLSLIQTEKSVSIPPSIIPRDFLEEVVSYIKGRDKLFINHSEKEKTVMFRADETEFYSRLIAEEFPPYQKVIPSESKTKVTVDAEEFMRNVKLVSLFARDFSNIVLVECVKGKIILRPKIEGTAEDIAEQEVVIEGDPQKIAFNYKFLLDFLTRVDTERIVMEVLRPDAPVVFRLPKKPGFLHIIMPVRIQE